MALIVFEGFDAWAAGTFTTQTTGQVGVNGLGAWSGSAGSLPAGTLGGKKVNCGNTANFFYNAGASFSAIVMGFRFSTTTLATTQSVMQFYDSAGAVQCTLGFSATQKLVLFRGAAGGTVLGTGSVTIVSGSDYYIECKIEFSNSAVAEVRVNGVADITLSGVDTTNTANNNVQTVGNPGTAGGSTVTYDDWYMLDTTGSAPYNDYLGIVRVETLFPTSNNSVQWTPNASTNVSRVQETAMDTDTTYNSDSTVGHIDTFNHGSLSSTPATIFSVKVTSEARKDDVVNRTYRNKIISNVTTSNGATYILPTVYRMIEDYFNNDPDTAAAWASAAAVNGTKIGYELVS